jgi:excisionase family DNA binding protein
MTRLVTREPVLPDTDDARSIERLESLLAHLEEHSDSVEQTRLVGPKGQEARLPRALYAILKLVVHEMAVGNAVTVAPVQAVLTTQQAAELLNTSRPFLVGLLEKGDIPFHYVGSHRRVNLRDVLDYKQRRSQKRKRALAEMANEAQLLSVYE